MLISEEQKNELMKCGRFNFPLSKVLIQLNIPSNEIPAFTLAFEAENSELRNIYEKGKVQTEFDIMSKLHFKIEQGKEGSDEAAKALNSMRKHQAYNELLKKHYNL